MIDPKIAEAAFALKKDELSQPVEGQFSVVLLRVTEIEPGKQRTFDEVKGEIRDRIAGERVGQKLQALHDRVETGRAKGKPLKEIAEELKLPFSEIAGHRPPRQEPPTARPPIEHADAARIAEAMFEASPGVETETLELTDGGYAWFEVLDVTPERQKPFEEVKAEVKRQLSSRPRSARRSQPSPPSRSQRQTGGETGAVAKELGAKVERTKPFKRTATPPGLPHGAVQQAFGLAKGGAASAPTPDGKARVIFRVADIIAAPAATAEQTAALKAELAKQMRVDLLEQYVGGLRTRYGDTVNEKLLKQALGSRPSNS